MSTQGKSEQQNLPSSAWRGLRSDAGGPFHTQLEAAKARYNEGAYQAAIELLRGLYPTADQSDPAGSEAARTNVLASARALEARALVRLGQDAREASRAAVAAFGSSMMSRGSDPMSAEERRDFGIVLYLSGQDALARDQLTQAIEAGAADAEVHRFRGLALMRLESFADAAQALTLSLQIEPGHLQALEALVHCLDRQTTPPEVMAQAYFHLVERYYAAGRLDDAFAACSRSAELADGLRAQTGLGIILTAQGQHERALAAFNHALEFDSTDSFVIFRRGEALRLLGRFDEALETFRRIPESANEHLLALGSSGAILRRQGHLDEALKALDLALERDPQYVFGLAVKADVVFDLGRTDEALELYQRVAAADPDSTWAPFRVADLLRVRERYGEALEIINRLLERAPTFVEALGTKGATLIGLGRRDEGIAVLDQALGPQPDYMFALLQKAQALIDLHRQADAIPVLRHILTLAPSTGLARQQLVEALRSAGQHDAALDEVDKVLHDLPDDPWYVGTKGQVLHDLGRNTDAVPLLERAVALDRTQMWALRSLADTERALGHYENAANAYDEMLKQKPDDVRTLGMKGDMLFSLNRYDEALKPLDRALELSKNDTFAMATKGQVLAALGRRPEAIDLLAEAVRLERERVRESPGAFKLTWALFDLAENLRIADRFAEAIEAYDELLGYQPKLPNALGGKGSALFVQERYDEALAALNSAIELKPDYAFGLAVKGALLASCGEFEAAIEPLTQATAADQSMSYAFYVKGFCYRVLGHYPEAEDTLLRARAITPNDSTTEYNLADVYRAIGQPDKATPIYEAIVARSTSEVDPDTTATVGWCYYRLGNYDRAVQCLADSVSRGRLMAHAQFDLALALLCSERAALAATEYGRGIEMATAEHQPWRRRGLYRLALHDIGIARRENPQAFADPQAASIEERLQGEYERTPKLTTAPATATATP